MYPSVDAAMRTARPANRKKSIFASSTLVWVQFCPLNSKTGYAYPLNYETRLFLPPERFGERFFFFHFFLLFSLCYCSTIHISWVQKIKPIFVLAEHDVMNNFCFWTKFIFFIDFELKISKFYLFSKSFEFLGVTKYLLKSG